MQLWFINCIIVVSIPSMMLGPVQTPLSVQGSGRVEARQLLWARAGCSPCLPGLMLYMKRCLQTISVQLWETWGWISALGMLHTGLNQTQTGTPINSGKVWFWTLWLGLLFNYRSLVKLVGKMLYIFSAKMVVQLKIFHRFHSLIIVSFYWGFRYI